MSHNLWRIDMFGGLRVSHHDGIATRFKTSKTGSLLAYLAYFPSAVHTREQLAALLWPEAEGPSSRASLRTALASLCRQLEPPGARGALLLADNATIRLNPASFTTDVQTFEAAVRDGRTITSPNHRIRVLMQAVDLSKGDLLPGLYEEWIERERRQLSEERMTALWILAEALEQQGEFQRALSYALQFAKADPLAEEACALVMRLYAALGRPSAALRCYSLLRNALRTELNTEPSAELQRMIRQIRREPEKLRAPALVSSSAISAVGVPSETAMSSRIVLPAPVTAFFGRELEIAQATSLLQGHNAEGCPECRLLTLTGIGGGGKTRLALAVADRLSNAFALVCFAPLSDLPGAAAIAPAILTALRVALIPGRDPLDQLEEALAGQSSLLVLDGFETLLSDDPAIEDGSSVVHALLTRVPSLRCLVTSRRLLQLPGEWEAPVPPLPSPPIEGAPDQLHAYASVQMFVNRARARRVDFAVTPRNADAVAALCGQLEGIPLAIELAAAHANLLSPAQMLAQLRHRFEFLVSAQKALPARHRTLWAAISWSYDRLSPRLRCFFCSLAFFRGGWGLEAAQSVCAEPHALDCLQHLCAHSLVTSFQDGDGMRFQMLDTLREFAEAQITEEERASLQRQHANHFLGLARTAAPHLFGSEQIRWLDMLEQEHDNLRASLQNLLGCEDSFLLAGALHQFWYMRGYLQEGSLWMKATLAAGKDAPEQHRSSACNASGVFAWMLGDYEYAQESFQVALAYRRRVNDLPAVAGLLNNLGLLALHRADFDSARAWLAQSVSLYRSLRETRLAGNGLGNLARVAMEQGDFSCAIVCLEEAEEIQRQIGDPATEAGLLQQRGILAFRQGDAPTAGRLLMSAQRLFVTIRDSSAFASLLMWLGAVESHLGHEETATALFAGAACLCRSLGAELESAEEARLQGWVAAARRRLGAVRFAAAWSRGQSLSATSDLGRIVETLCPRLLTP